MPKSKCDPRPTGRLSYALGAADIVRTEDDSRHFVTNKIGDELLQAFIAVKINFIIHRRIIMQNFRRNVILRSAAHYDFIYPHGERVIAPAIHVETGFIPREL